MALFPHPLALVAPMLLAAACQPSETWVAAPSASVVVDLEAGTTRVRGEAVLGYDRALLPEAIVSNALRLEAVADSGETLYLDFPDADDADLIPFQDPGALNLDPVYTDCGTERCEVVVRFEVLRTATEATVMTLAGDALLSRASTLHRTAPDDDAAQLDLVVR